MNASPGNSPPKTKNEMYVPTTGIDCDQALGDPQPGAGQQVVGQRVAGEALDDAELQQRRRRSAS